MPGKILLVEDQNAFIFQAHLDAHNGFDFAVVKRGDLVLEAFKQHRPSLVLMDIRLPVMDGLEAVRQVRRLDVSIPIIVFTAFSDGSTRDKALAAGATEFWVKPFDYGHLYRRMAHLICEHQANDREETADCHRQTMIDNKRRRLRALEERQAMLGLSTPVEMTLEIEDLRNDIADLEAGLGG